MSDEQQALELSAEAYARGRADERKAIVEWLEQTNLGDPGCNFRRSALIIASSISRGEHLVGPRASIEPEGK